MRVLEKKQKQKAWVWEDSCEICESRLRMYEDRDDPDIIHVKEFGSYAYEIKYTCPVCGETQRAWAPRYGCGPVNNVECERRRRMCETTREEVVLTLEDRAELKTYKDNKILSFD